MGQTTIGVLYGVEVPKGLHLREKGEGLLDKWEGLPAKTRGQPGIVTTWEGDRGLIGVWVAVAGDTSEHKGALDISGKCIPADKLVELAPAPKAHQAWERFSEWALDQGVDFVKPQMWLAPTETA